MSANIMIPDIPLDIIHLIFKRLEWLDERKILARCSQVCRCWYPAAREALASQSVIVPMATKAFKDQRTQWAEWRGQCMALPIDPPRIVRLEIVEGDFFDYAWLAATLALLPRLRHLIVGVLELSNFTSQQETLPALEHQLDILQLYGLGLQGRPRQPAGLLLFLLLFPRIKSIHVQAPSLEIYPGTPVVCDISPSAVTVDGLRHYHFSSWLRIFGQPQVARGIRHLRLTCNDATVLCSLRLVRLFTSVENLETIEFDLCKYTLHSGTDPSSFPGAFEHTLGPAFSSKLRTLSLRILRIPVKCSPKLLFLTLLNAMPTTLHHVEIRVGSFTYDAGISAIAESMKDYFMRFPDLRTFDVILDDRQVTPATADGIAKYRKYLEDGFPELVARGVLRLTSEVPSEWDLMGPAVGHPL